MKKVFIIVISFLFISCFTEPKKIEKTTDKTANEEVDDLKESINLLDTIKNNDIEVKKDSIVADKKEIKNNICIEKLVSLLNKSADEFENFAFENNYYFDEVKMYDSFKVLYYKKSNSIVCFAVDKLDNTSMGIIQFETNSKNLYLSLKDEALKLGYNYVNTKTFDKQISDSERLYSEYSDGKHELNFIITNEPNKLGYSVGISKIKNR